MSHLMSKINWPTIILDSGEPITNGVGSLNSKPVLRRRVRV